MRHEVRSVRALFRDDGTIDIQVGYRMGSEAKLPNPGTKARQNLAKKMAQYAFEKALRSLIKYPMQWGGFAMGEVDVTDCLVADVRGKESA